MSRLLRLACVATLALLAICLGYLLLPGAKPRVSKAICEKIQEGMSEQEVEELIGGPAGDYTTGPFEEAPDISDIIGESETTERWITDEGDILVRFGRDGRVVHARFKEVDRLPESFLARIRRWVKRRIPV